METKAQRVIDEAEQVIRIGKLYLALSVSPLVVLLANALSGIDAENTFSKMVITICFLSLSLASGIIVLKIAKNHEVIQIVASVRRKLGSGDDIADEEVDAFFSNVASKSDLYISIYMVSLLVGYLSLILIVAMLVWV